MLSFKSDKEVFDYVRTFDLCGLKPLSAQLEKYAFNFIDIDTLLEHLYDEDTLIVDARSEKEFGETSIPTAVNFPVLNTEERHNVGIVFKNYSDLAAVELAVQYSAKKAETLNDFLEEHGANDKNIYVYCWRGGGRSKYLSKMIFDAGYKPHSLIKGIKSYRHKVNELFTAEVFPNKLIEINGLTGSGKTEIIKALHGKLPTLDLEKAARHFSSLFGFIPYKIRGYSPVHNQTAFENNVYAEYVNNRNIFGGYETYIVESESRKVGDFFIPLNLYAEIENAKVINIETSFENRVKRLKTDYFEYSSGYADMINILKTKERFFRKEMSSVHYESCLDALNKGNAKEFISVMLEKYYDVKYKNKGKKPIAVINNGDAKEAANQIMRIYSDIEGLSEL
ncbi:MAG: tRNA 2-selenouridine(34) synthase MnmH [Ignavibacteria bacterium]